MCASQVCPIAGLRKLLLATDGSKMSEDAVKEAIGLAKSCGSDLYVISVVEVNIELEAFAPGLFEKAEKKIRKQLESIKTRALKAGIKCEIIIKEGEEPYKNIVDVAAKKKVQMIVMGRHGRRGLKRLLMGSVTSKVIGHTQCKVLVVP